MPPVSTPAAPALPHGGGLAVQAQPSLAALLPEMAARATWRWKWQLAPIATAATLGACGQTPVLTVPLAAAAGAGYWAHRTNVTVAGRMWLSRRERLIASTWLGAASAWTLTAPALHMSPRLAVATLAAAVGWPSYQWAASRLPKRAKLSPAARTLIANWSGLVTLHGPTPVLGSAVVRSTITEPGPGAVTFEVELAQGVHAREAASDTARQAVERLLQLPVDTVTFAVVRDDSGRIRVTLSPNRHLESAPVEWPGPMLETSGLEPLGVEPNGKRVAIALFNDEGVEHALLAGTSGAGKTGTVAAILLPGPAYGVETVWFLDGGEGTSAPFLEPACDWYACTQAEWIAAIDAAYEVMLERQYRRGRGAKSLELKAKDAWHMWDEEDPILTLFIEEAPTVGKKIPKRCHDRVVEMLQKGRKLGIRVVQVAQSPKFDHLIGGIDARNLMTGAGSVIALRPGGSNDARLTLDSTDVDLDLRMLPPEPGFAAVVRKGKVLAPVMRIANAKPRAEAEAAKITPRALSGRDELAAGANYLKRRDPDSFIPAQPATATAAEGTDEESAQQIAESDAVILKLLRASEGGMMLQDIAGDDSGAGKHPEWQWSRKTASNALMRLSQQELVTKQGARWVALEQPAEETR